LLELGGNYNVVQDNYLRGGSQGILVTGPLPNRVVIQRNTFTKQIWNNIYVVLTGGAGGANAEILIQYMKWLTNNRLKSIRLNPIFDKVPNPISWITNWTESKSIQEAPQETEKETYVVGAFQQLDENENFDEFSI
jgi:hypothetical protein